MKDRIKNYLSGKGRQALLIPYVLAGFIAVFGLVLTYAVMAPSEKANADYPAPAHYSARDAKEATKRAVLHWMEENSHMPQQVLSRVYGAAMKSINPDLVLAICVVESNFNPHAESDQGAVGLMGIMPDVWFEDLKAHGIVNAREDLYTIPNNIASGVYVLKWCLASTNDLREALRRYSGGDSEYPNKVLRAVEKISLARQSRTSLLQAPGTDG